MLTKCVIAKATLIVPDMEDSVPMAEKPKSRLMIKNKLEFIRQNASLGQNAVITPRTNDLETGLFHDDVKTILDSHTASLIDG
jgi:citrate lyase beta subunit